MRVRLTLAISEYEHVRDLTSGRVVPEGVELTCLSLPIEEIFFRFIHFREWEVSELSFAKYLALRAGGDESLTALPVFPSRVCRHSSIFVRRDGPTKPEELAGARIGVPEWAQTAAVYSRALLMHEWKVPLESIEWFQAGVNQAGRREKVALQLPEGVRLTPVADRSLDELLRAGELDAVLSAHPPASFERGEGWIRRLFPEFEPVEREYVARTGIFPIMHVIAMKSEVLAGTPWVAGSLMSAFEEAKGRCEGRLVEMTASRLPIPWAPLRVEETRELLGGSFWPYGVEANRTTLEAFVRFAAEQGVIGAPVPVESLFPRQLLDEYRV